MILPNDLIDDRFRILKILGRGGYGTVYMARQLDLGRDVAIKFIDGVLNPHPEQVERLRREAFILSQLRHKNVVSLFSCGVFKGVPYVVLEYVTGSSLESLLEGGPLPPRRIVGILKQVCEGLAHAHSHGIVHRDLKPSNVMIGIDPLTNGDLVHVIDFGLARLLPECGLSVQALTKSGMTLGTVVYMGPEQWASSKVDARSDLYSLGCILYYCLSGRAPFAQYKEEQLVLLGQLDPCAPVAHPESDDKSLSVALETIIRKCVEKNPDDRYQSAQELLNDIERAEAGKFILPNRKPVPTLRWVSAFRVPALLAALFCILVVASIVAIRKPQVQQSVELPPMSPDHYRQEIMSLLDTKKEYAKALELANRHVKARPSAESYLMRSRCFYYLGDPRAIDDAKQCLLYRSSGTNQQSYYSNLVNSLIMFGRYDEAAKFCREHLADPDLSSSDSISWIAHLGDILADCGENRKAIEFLAERCWFLRSAEAASVEMVTEEKARVALKLLFLYLRSGNYPAARDITHKIEKGLLSNQSMLTSRASYLLFEIGAEWKGCDIREAERICSVAESALRPDDIGAMNSLNQLRCLILRDQGHADEALRLSKKNLDYMSLHANPTLAEQSLFTHVELLRSLGENHAAEASKLLETHLEKCHRERPDWNNTTTLRNLASVYYGSLPDYKKSVPYMRELLAQDQRFGSRLPLTVAQDYSLWSDIDYAFFQTEQMLKHFHERNEVLQPGSQQGQDAVSLVQMLRKEANEDIGAFENTAAENVFKRIFEFAENHKAEIKQNSGANKLSSLLVSIRIEYADLLYKTNRDTEALIVWQSVEEELGRWPIGNDFTLTGHRELADFLQRFDFNEKAFAVYEKGLGLNSANAGDPRMRSYFYREMGAVRVQQGRYSEAANLFNKAISVLLPVGSIGVDHLIQSKLCYAEVQQYLNKPSEALKTCHDTLYIAHKYAANRGHWTDCYLTYSFIFIAQNKFSESIAAMKTALEMNDQTVQTRAPLYRVAFRDPLAVVLIRSRQWEQAKSLLQFIDSTNFGQERMHRPEIMALMAVVELKMGNYERALQLGQESQAVSDKLHIVPCRFIFNADRYMASVYVQSIALARLGRNDEAARLFDICANDLSHHEGPRDAIIQAMILESMDSVKAWENKSYFSRFRDAYQRLRFTRTW